MNIDTRIVILAALLNGCANCSDGGLTVGAPDAGDDASRPDMRSTPTDDVALPPVEDADASSTPDAGPVCGADEEACTTDVGPVCCAAAEACLFGACIELGDACEDSRDCPFEEYCEPTVQRCVDFSVDPNACIYQPPVGEFSPVEAFAWTASTVSPEFDQVMSAPMVANLTDDNGDGVIDLDDTPDIAFSTFSGGGYNSPGVLRVISGADGTEHWASTGLDAPFDVRGATSPALADIDGDGVVEMIIEGGTDGGVYALEHDGKIKWHQPNARGPSSSSPTVVNLDGAGPPEIIVLTEVLNADGEIVCSGLPGSSMAVPADIDGDGKLEFLMGSHVYRLVDASATDGSGCEQVRPGTGGLTAVADFDADGDPEIVLLANGTLFLQDHEGNELWNVPMPMDLPRLAADYGIADCNAAPAGQACTDNAECGASPARCYGGACILTTLCLPGGGPPTIADFDGDGAPEIGIAARWYYVVVDGDGSILWAHKTRDFSSAATGSSVFDFEGDGRAEVVYNDELFLRVYSGVGAGVDADGDGFTDADILLEVPNSSGTLVEYPLIVDVDNDGSAEIVVAANDYAFGDTKGIRVFKDAENRWVGTRPIWNQHVYYVTNVNDDGTVPTVPASNWLEPRLNNFRQNVQGGNPQAAPNLTATIDQVDATTCSSSGVKFEFTVRNEGALGLRAGQLDVTLYAGPAGEALAPIVTLQNTMPLPPGGAETFQHTWMPPGSLAGQRFDSRVVVDDDGTGVGKHNECVESDNESTGPTTLCAVPQ